MKLERDLTAGESEFQRDWGHWRALPDSRGIINTTRAESLEN